LQDDITAFHKDFEKVSKYLEDPKGGEILKRECIIFELRQLVTVERQVSDSRNRSRIAFRNRMRTGRKRNIRLSKENAVLKWKLVNATKKIRDLVQQNAATDEKLFSAAEGFEDLHQCWDGDSQDLREELVDLRRIIEEKADEIFSLEKDNSSLYSQLQALQKEKEDGDKNLQDVHDQLLNLNKVAQTNESFIQKIQADLTKLNLRDQLRPATSFESQFSHEQGIPSLSQQSNTLHSDSEEETSGAALNTHLFTGARDLGQSPRARLQSNHPASTATASSRPRIRRNPLSAQRQRVYLAIKKLTDHQLILLEPDISGVSKIVPGIGYHWVNGVSSTEPLGSCIKLISLQHIRMNPKNRPPGYDEAVSKIEDKQKSEF